MWICAWMWIITTQHSREKKWERERKKRTYTKHSQLQWSACINVYEWTWAFVFLFLVLLEKHNVKTFSMLEQQNIKRIWKRVIVKWRFCILSNALYRKSYQKVAHTHGLKTILWKLLWLFVAIRCRRKITHSRNNIRKVSLHTIYICSHKQKRTKKQHRHTHTKPVSSEKKLKVLNAKCLVIFHFFFRLRGKGNCESLNNIQE